MGVKTAGSSGAGVLSDPQPFPYQLQIYLSWAACLGVLELTKGITILLSISARFALDSDRRTATLIGKILQVLGVHLQGIGVAG